MKKSIIAVFIISAIVMTGCSTQGYLSSGDYPDRRYNQGYDPFLYGPGNYGYDSYGYSPYGYNPYRYNPYRYNRYNNANRYGYDPTIRRRTPVIVQKTAPVTPLPPVKVRPINPRTDKWERNKNN